MLIHFYFIPGCSAPAVEEKTEEEADDDFDLFGSEDEEEAEKRHAAALAAYNAKNAAKPKPVAKSMIILDVKPWDDETDMNALENSVRSIQADGLLWGTSKMVPIVQGIKKLQITCVVEDDKVCLLIYSFDDDYTDNLICTLRIFRLEPISLKRKFLSSMTTSNQLISQRLTNCNMII